jgi:hypothetical protein
LKRWLLVRIAPGGAPMLLGGSSDGMVAFMRRFRCSLEITLDNIIPVYFVRSWPNALSQFSMWKVLAILPSLMV